LVLGNSNALSSGGVTVNGGTLNLNGLSVTANQLRGAGGTIALGGGALTVNNTSTTTNASVISGTGSFTKAGSGNLLLAGNSTYTGDTFLENANIQLGVANALSTNSVLRFSANANNRRLQMQGFNQTLGGVDSTGSTGGMIIEAASDNVSFAPATLTLNVAAGQSHNFSGFVRDAAGTATNSVLTLVKNGAGTQVLSGGVNVSYSGNTTINAGVLEFAGTNNVANNSAITLGSNGTVRFSGGGTRGAAIAGTGTLEKTGANTLTLSGNNSFSGALSVQAGLLGLNTIGGAAAGSVTSVSVATNAILLLSQSEQVNDMAAVSLSGGTIQRGSGVSEVFGSLTLTTGSFLDFGTGDAGNLTFGTYQNNNETPSALLTLNNFLPGNSFTFSSTSFSTNSVGSYFTFGTGYVGSSISSTGSTFTITAIPEPSTYLAAAGLLAVLLWPSRRRLLKDTKSVLGLRRPKRERSA
jgi:fibronectin-binding autotransporter adhesin